MHIYIFYIYTYIYIFCSEFPDAHQSISWYTPMNNVEEKHVMILQFLSVITVEFLKINLLRFAVTLIDNKCSFFKKISKKNLVLSLHVIK